MSFEAGNGGVQVEWSMPGRAQRFRISLKKPQLQLSSLK